MTVYDEALSDAVYLRRILAEQGLDDDGASPHSWRCDHKDRYPDYCTCVAEIIDAIIAAGFRRYPSDPVTEWEYNVAEDGEVADEGVSWYGDADPEFDPPLRPDEKVVRRRPAGAWEPVGDAT